MTQPKPASEWTANDLQDLFRGLSAKLAEAAEANEKAESLFRKIEASEKSVLDLIFLDLRAVNPDESNVLLERMARASKEYREFLEGMAAARSAFLKARHAHEIARVNFEGFRTVASSVREQWKQGG